MREDFTVNNRFGQFLVNSGVLDEVAVYDAMNIQMKMKEPIGMIALKEKALTLPQVFNILNKQADTPKFFGEIAVDLEYLDKEGIEKLLAIQQEGMPAIEDILVEMKKIDNETCAAMLEKFYKLASG